ncbi:hypothetical protein [Streptomyces lonegramiae]|uniref:Protein kinase domain-containing protein n=1 Tax=Streptomyces lonegramiae TaxID=3075524 RepID=A0ABU2XCF8_9ACTN|nr:hypothetical protein [Streptomyces sp. DSM 41529]MDT0543149.1 hypothetical protein [Streptomyces sp. DSM 41529]
MSEAVEWSTAVDCYTTSLGTHTPLDRDIAMAAAPVAVVVARKAIFHAHAVVPERSLAVRHVAGLARAFTGDDPEGVGALLDFWHFVWTGRFATGGFLGDEVLPHSLKTSLQAIVSAGGRPALQAAQEGLLREAQRRLESDTQAAAAANHVMGKELFLRPMRAFTEEGPDACLLLTRTPADAVKSVNGALLKPLTMGGVRYQQMVETAARIADRMREVLTLTDIVRDSPPHLPLRLADDDVAQLSAAARVLLPMVLLDLVEQSADSFDPAPVLELVEERLSLPEVEESLRPALALSEAGRKGGAVAEALTYLASIRGRLDSIARHISESPELVEFLEEVRAEVAQGWTGQVDSLLELARPLVARGRRLERARALRDKLAEGSTGAVDGDDEETTDDEKSTLARLAAVVDIAERTEDEEAAEQLLAMAEEMTQQRTPDESTSGGAHRASPRGTAVVPSGKSLAVPPILLLAELLEEPWHPLLQQTLRSVTGAEAAATAAAFEEMARGGTGPAQRAAAVCAIGWSVFGGDPDRALEQHARLAERASRSATRHWNEGCARGALGDIDGAVTAFEAVARLGGSPPQLVVQPVMQLFRAAGRPCPFRQPLRHGPVPDARIDAFVMQRFEVTAKRMRLSGRTADAELLLEALTEVCATAPGRSQLMKIYREEHRLADAERFVSRMTSRGAADWMLDFDLALVAAESGTVRRARELRDLLAVAGAPRQHLLQLDRRLAHPRSAVSVPPLPVQGPSAHGAPPELPTQPRPDDRALPPILLHEDLLALDADSLPRGLLSVLTRIESPLDVAQGFADWAADTDGAAAQAAAVCAVGWACRAGDADLAANWADSLLPADASGWLLWNRACALELLQDTEGAARILETALSTGDQPPPAVWPRVAERLIAADKPVPPSPYNASAAPCPAARISSTTVQRFESLAKRLFAVGRRRDAEWLLRALVEAAPRTPGQLLLMKIWREDRRLDDALALVSQRRALGEDDWRLCYEAGLVAVAAGRPNVALDMRRQVAALGAPHDWVAQLDRRIGALHVHTGPQPINGIRIAMTSEQHIVQEALNSRQDKTALLEPARDLLDERGPSPVLAVARQLERTAPWARLTLLDLLIDRVAEQPDREAPAGLVEQVVACGDAKLVARLASALDDSGDHREATRLLAEFAEQCRPTQRPRIWHRLVELLRSHGEDEEADRVIARTAPPRPRQPLQPDPGRAVRLLPRHSHLVLPPRPEDEPALLHEAQELDQLHGPEAAADAWCAALEAGYVLAYPHTLGTLVAGGRAVEALELYRRYADRFWTGSTAAWNIAAAYAQLGLLEQAADTLEIEAQISSLTALGSEDRAAVDKIFRLVHRPSPRGLLTPNSASVIVGPATPRTGPSLDQAAPDSSGVGAVPALRSAAEGTAPAAQDELHSSEPAVTSPPPIRAKPEEWENWRLSDTFRNSLRDSAPGSPQFDRQTMRIRASCGRLIEGLLGEAERFIRPTPRPLSPELMKRMSPAAAAAFTAGLTAAQEDRWHEAADAWRTAYDAHPRNEVIASDLVLALLRTEEHALAQPVVEGFAFSNAFIRPRAALAHALGGPAVAIEEIARMRDEDLGLGRTELSLAKAGLEFHHLQDPYAAGRTLLSVATDRPPGLARMFGVVALLLGQDADDDELVAEAYRCLLPSVQHINEIVAAALRDRRPDHLMLVSGLLSPGPLKRLAQARSAELARDQPSHRRLQVMRSLLEQRRAVSPDARWLWARMLWQDGESAEAAQAYREVVQELAVAPGRPRLAPAVEEWIQAARSSGDPARHWEALDTKQELGLPMRTRELEILRGDEVAQESLLFDLNADLVSFEAADVVNARSEAVHRLERVVESVRSVAAGSQDEITVDQLVDIWYHQLAQDIDTEEGRIHLMVLRRQAKELSTRVGDRPLRNAAERVSVVTYRLWEESGRRLLPPRVKGAFLVTESELWCHDEGPLHVRLTVEPQEDGGRVRIGCNGSPYAEVELDRGRRQQVVFRVDELYEVDRVELDFWVYRPDAGEAENLKMAFPVEHRRWLEELASHAFAAGSPADQRIRVPREAELTQLRHHYRDRLAAPVRFLHGPRQVGKTTLARSLSAHPLPESPTDWPLPGVLAVEVNGEKWSHLHKASLWEWLASQIRKGAQKAWLAGVTWSEALPATGDEFGDWLTGMSLAGLDGWRLLLMIDEFQTLLDRVNESGHPIAHLGDQLRAMASDPDTPLLLLTLGSCSFESLKARLVPHGSNLTDEIREFPVGFMEPEQARMIFQRGFDDGVFLQRAVVERVVEYTGGYPYHVHCMGEELAKRLAGRKASIITLEDVESAAEALIERPEVIKPFSDMEREPGVAQAIAYLLENETAPDEDELIIDGDAVDLATEPEVDRGLDRIKELGLIRRYGHSDWVWSNRLIHIGLKQRHARQRLKAQARKAAQAPPVASVPAAETTVSPGDNPAANTSGDPAQALRRAGFVVVDRLGVQSLDEFPTVWKVTLNGRAAVAKLLNPYRDETRLNALRARFNALDMSAISGAPSLLPEQPVVDGRWFVFEWTDGRTLAEVMTEEDRFPYTWQRAVGWINDAADIVSRAYRESGLTHGDVKPENLVLAPDGRVTVLDWGGGNLAGDPSPILDDHAFDPRYTPEERRFDIGGSDDPRGVLPQDDAYSLGATLFQLVHPQRKPLSHLAPGGCDRQIVEAHFDNVEDKTSWQLASLLRKALLARPERRFRNAEELAAALREVPRT